jgi:hypothetical protein
MNYAKYVVVIRNGVETPIIFPPWIDHNSMVNRGEVVVGAGQCDIVGEQVLVHGKSTTLNAVPSPHDARWLTRMLFPH